MPGIKSVKFIKVQNSETKALDSASQLGPALGNRTLFQTSFHSCKTYLRPASYADCGKIFKSQL